MCIRKECVLQRRNEDTDDSNAYFKKIKYAG